MLLAEITVNKKQNQKQEIMSKGNAIIIATANYSKRTFTIRKTYSDGLKTKYRTIQFSKEDFNSELMNTENDWKDFLKGQDYYKL